MCWFFDDVEKPTHPTGKLWHAAACGFCRVQAAHQTGETRLVCQRQTPFSFHRKQFYPSIKQANSQLFPIRAKGNCQHTVAAEMLLVDLFSSLGVPEGEGACGAAGDEQLAVGGVGDAGVPFLFGGGGDGLDWCAVCDVPEAEGAVLAGGGEGAGAWAGCYGGDGLLVGGEGVADCAGGGVPDLYGELGCGLFACTCGAGDEGGALVMEGQVGGGAVCGVQAVDGLGVVGVPEEDFVGLTGGGYPAALGAGGDALQRSAWLRVGLCVAAAQDVQDGEAAGGVVVGDGEFMGTEEGQGLLGLGGVGEGYLSVGLQQVQADGAVASSGCEDGAVGGVGEGVDGCLGEGYALIGGGFLGIPEQDFAAGIAAGGEGGVVGKPGDAEDASAAVVEGLAGGSCAWVPDAGGAVYAGTGEMVAVGGIGEAADDDEAGVSLQGLFDGSVGYFEDADVVVGCADGKVGIVGTESEAGGPAAGSLFVFLREGVESARCAGGGVGLAGGDGPEADGAIAGG